MLVVTAGGTVGFASIFCCGWAAKAANPLDGGDRSPYPSLIDFRVPRCGAHSDIAGLRPCRLETKEHEHVARLRTDRQGSDERK